MKSIYYDMIKISELELQSESTVKQNVGSKQFSGFPCTVCIMCILYSPHRYPAHDGYTGALCCIPPKHKGLAVLD